MDEEKQPSTNTVLPAEEKKSASPHLILGALALVVVLAVVFGMRGFKGEEVVVEPIAPPQKDMTLRIEPPEVHIPANEIVHLKLWQGDQDVTEQATWKSSAPEIVRVEDTPTAKGAMSGSIATGTAMVIAEYQGKTIQQEVTITTPDFQFACAPNRRTIPLGEPVAWISVRVSGGKGPFVYEWSGDVVENGQTVMITYTKTGVQTEQLQVTDSLGMVTQADCGPVEVVNK